MNKYLRSFFLFIIPSFMLKKLKIGKVGFSIILVDDWQSVPSARIGHFNFIKCQALHMEEHAQIGHLNLAMGYVKILLEKNSYIGNFNSFHAKKHKSKCYSLPYLRLHQSAKIMGHHYLDLIQSIDIGERSILAGAFSQCWTHSYIYGKEKHVRLDGTINIGSNCYIGASCILLPGICIGDNITLGAGTTCSKSVTEQGVYVSSKLQYIPYDADERIKSLGKPMAIIDGVERYKKE